MCAKLLFAITVVFCVRLAVTATKEITENHVFINQSERLDYKPVRIAEKEEFHYEGYNLYTPQEDGCKCKNGTCMRVCDVEKSVPCLDKRKMCVCSAEFGEYEPGECEYCDCGIGFSCTYSGWNHRKSCICPRGYINSYGKCRLACSGERRCLNEGTCHFGECWCKSGFSGDFCEVSDQCKGLCPNKQDADCVYSWENQHFYCRCKDPFLVYDYYTDSCTPCSCGNGKCVYDAFTPKCECQYGYKDYKGYCRECDCGVGSECEFNLSGEKVCKCKEGTYAREGLCLPCSCRYAWDERVKCEVINNVKRCLCDAGFEDVLGQCADIDECERNNTCHPSTKCYNFYGTFQCRCRGGYKNPDGDEYSKVQPGKACLDINECETTTSACSYRGNAKCVNLPGSYKCVCLPGYEPRDYSVEPFSTFCTAATKDWGPAAIVIFTSIGIIVAGALVHGRVRRRALRSNIEESIGNGR